MQDTAGTPPKTPIATLVTIDDKEKPLVATICCPYCGGKIEIHGTDV